MLDPDLLALLSTVTELTAAVGTRMFPAAAPQPTVQAAYLTYQCLIDSGLPILAGKSKLRKTTFQLDCYSRQVSETKTAIEAIYDRFRNEYTGTVGNSVISSVRVEIHGDGYTLPAQQTDRGIYRASCDITVFYARGDR